MTQYERSAATLELPAILEMLAKRAVSEAAKERAMALSPTTDRAAAKRLLAETQLPVEKVGEICGFGSLVHFSRSFKASVGIPPSIYRKQLVKLA